MNSPSVMMRRRALLGMMGRGQRQPTMALGTAVADRSRRMGRIATVQIHNDHNNNNNSSSNKGYCYPSKTLFSTTTANHATIKNPGDDSDVDEDDDDDDEWTCLPSRPPSPKKMPTSDDCGSKQETKGLQEKRTATTTTTIPPLADDDNDEWTCLPSRPPRNGNQKGGTN